MEAQPRVCGQCGDLVKSSTKLTPYGQKQVCPRCLPGQQQRVGKEIDVTVSVWSETQG